MQLKTWTLSLSPAFCLSSSFCSVLLSWLFDSSLQKFGLSLLYLIGFSCFFVKNEEKHSQKSPADIEVKSNLTIARGEWGGDSGERGLEELL